MLASLALTALMGGLVGGLAGFVVAVLQLQGKHLRNARLLAAGQPGIRDCVLIAWHWPCAALGALASPLLCAWLPMGLAIALGGSTVPALLLALFAASLVRQSRARGAE